VHDFKSTCEYSPNTYNETKSERLIFICEKTNA
jgi:hypothetical protein